MLIVSVENTNLGSDFSHEFIKNPVSSPIGIYLELEAIIFSTKVEPLLGTPTIKIGFIF